MPDKLNLKEYVDSKFSALAREQDKADARNVQGWAMLQEMLEQVDKRSLERFSHMEHTATLMNSNIDTRFTGIDKATALANAAMDKRLDGMNEIRMQMRDKDTLYATRVEVQAETTANKVAIERSVERLNLLEQANANARGRAEQNNASLQSRMWVIGICVLLASIASSIALHFIH